MMKIITPTQLTRSQLCLEEAMAVVLPIIRDVRTHGDSALRRYAQQFDQRTLTDILVSPERRSQAQVSSEVLRALLLAKENITAYHTAQLPQEWWLDIAPGVRAGQLIRPLECVGCYVPGGRYPLVSTVLMTALIAKIAGVKRVVVCTPHALPEMLVACDLVGVDLVAEVGGAQAIAAMAYGTGSIPKVDKIVGPGNRYVTAAKKAVYGDVCIDCLAGPSEVLIIADETSNPSFVAADLLAQAEHDDDAIAVLVTPSKPLADEVLQELERQLVTLPTQVTARRALENNGRIVITRDLAQAFEVSNRFAPEHLEIHVNDPTLLRWVTNAGAVFLGEYSAEAFGDYATGPSHVLPTGGIARAQSGLSVLDFIRLPSVQQLTPQGAKRLANITETLARLEGLEAHARAALRRIV